MVTNNVVIDLTLTPEQIEAREQRKAMLQSQAALLAQAKDANELRELLASLLESREAEGFERYLETRE